MRHQKNYYDYMLASGPDGKLYTGITSDLAGRLWQHRTGALGGYAARYGIRALVWYQAFDGPDDAIAFEKRLKKWRRAWKTALIEAANPAWRDLSADF